MSSILGIPGARLLAAIILAGLASLATGASAQSDKVMTLDIEPQNVGSAIVALGKSSGVQIILPGDAGADVRVEGLKGEYRLEEALSILLSGTGLAYEFTSENTIVVDEAQESSDENGGGDAKAEDDDETEGQEEEPLELEKQRVTGSRLRGGDPTANVISLTAEDLARRGISSVEELFRQMPWAYASNTSQSSRHYSAPVDVDREISTGDGMGIGVSFANLRALGSENSLVLVNGRRVSGRGGSEYNAVNLVNIPLSAIERVDIDLGSASAIYGSDAIGGVINFITRKRFSGLELTVRQELSATDADRRVMSARGGYAWGSGSVTANLSRDESEPVNNRKIWTSMDYRDVLGPEYDRRSATAQPGIVCRAAWRVLCYVLAGPSEMRIWRPAPAASARTQRRRGDSGRLHGGTCAVRLRATPKRVGFGEPGPERARRAVLRGGPDDLWGGGFFPNTMPISRNGPLRTTTSLGPTMPTTRSDTTWR